jgi:hypothetical protein
VKTSPASAVRPDREGLLCRDRSGVELGHGLVDRDAGLRIAGHDRPLDRSRATPAREERRVDVEPEPLGERLGRDQQAIGADDDDRRVEREPRERALGLEHGDPEAVGDSLRGAAPSGGGPVPRVRRDA